MSLEDCQRSKIVAQSVTGRALVTRILWGSYPIAVLVASNKQEQEQESRKESGSNT